MNLHNKKNKDQLLLDLKNENFDRITCSFYKYIQLKNLEKLRDDLYIEWNELRILGRIYIATEGINAQLSVPAHNWGKFIGNLYSKTPLKEINIKTAIQEGLSFYKLMVKIKKEIVAYKVPAKKYDMNKIGNHLNFVEFNQAIDNGAIVIDMRNYYESEVGRFESAILPDVEKSEELLPEIRRLLSGHEDDKVLMYCTGGVRCEKASSYLIKQGFNDVNQLNGGIIQYAKEIKKQGIKSKFIGKNFVFDQRLGERITDDIISKCHQCNKPADNHIDCANEACHILFIQCKKCEDKYSKCCSVECVEFIKLPKNEQKQRFSEGKIKFTAQKSRRIKPKLVDFNS